MSIAARMRCDAVEIFTIGHSTRTLEEFLALLRRHDITLVADIRTHPGSRRFPHFDSEVLEASLGEAGIGYAHIAELGGRRRVRPDASPSAWRNASFHGYADYMTTPEFERGLEHLIAFGEGARTVIMCAEAVPWRCHRSLVADALLAREIRVFDIIGTGSPAAPHRITKFAHVDDGRVTYPPEQGELDAARGTTVALEEHEG
ncbi:MAG: DUF488 family protein [Gemmatimonadaceae bacterium]